MLAGLSHVLVGPLPVLRLCLNRGARARIWLVAQAERVASSHGRSAPLRSGRELFDRLTLYYGIGLMLGAYAHRGTGTNGWSERSDDPVLRTAAVVARAREDGGRVPELRAG